MIKKQKPTTKYDEHKLAVGEVKRHMSALSEKYQSRIDGVVEQFAGMNRRFDLVDRKLDTHAEIITRMMVQLEEIKSESRQRVDLQLFAKLEKRVALLESKTHHR